MNFLMSAPNATWCRGLNQEGATALHPNDAAARLTTGGYLEIETEPRFKFSRDSCFFAIGSCFALNISRAIVRQGFKVLSWGFDHPRSMQLLTKFNTYSMLTEVEVALSGRELIDGGLIELSDGCFWDPQLHHSDITSRDEALALRAKVTEHFTKVKDADVCIITLGLTEMFWDTITDIPLNSGIVDWRHAKKTGRFEFHNPGYEKILDNVIALCSLLRDSSGNKLKIILTVSPVPLQRTFSGKDIIVANNYSKSVLRAVAEEVCKKLCYVDYYPAYETVTFTSRELAWEPDQRHVRNAMVDHVISNFLRRYIEN